MVWVIGITLLHIFTNLMYRNIYRNSDNCVLYIFYPHFINIVYYRDTSHCVSVPDSSPRDIQLVFTARSALISWQAPLPMEDKGKSHLNPSNAKATFSQSTRMQRFLKII